jgi:putative drug exporter of the RND superfamily
MTPPTHSDGPARHTGALARLARACALHPRRTIVAWVALLVVAFGSSAMFGGRLVNEFTIPGSETQQATDLLKSRFTSLSGDSAMVVFTSDKGLDMLHRARTHVRRSLSAYLQPVEEAA